MPIDVATMEQALAMAAAVPDSVEFSELDSRAEVLGFLVAVSRSEGWDECDMVEIAVRAAEMTAGELRLVRDTLKPLGYVKVAALLTELARKAKR